MFGIKFGKRKPDVIDQVIAKVATFGEVNPDNWPTYKVLVELGFWVSSALDLGKRKADATSFLYALEAAEQHLPADMPEEWRAEILDDMREQWASSLGLPSPLI